ncbi:MAG: glycosyltransferase [Microscillaceae bacterium]|nr:glycosyltransferase [Microscillaceae bacterium]
MIKPHSSTSKTAYSLVIAYRDRDVTLVRRCLESIQNQSFKNFELIFVDYGSHSAQQEAVKVLCNQDERFRYIFTNTCGMYWNKSRALNLAFSQSRSEVVVVVDVDLILPKNFLESVRQEFDPKYILNYKVYYLSKSFKNYEYLEKKASKLRNYLPKSDIYANGTIVISKQVFGEIRGYDEYYRIWGLEDTDLIDRCEAKGVTRQIMDREDTVVFHQWHPHSNLDMPQGWDAVSHHYFENKKKQSLAQLNELKIQSSTHQILSLKERPALHIFEKPEKSTGSWFQFGYPKVETLLGFMQRFMALGTGEYVYVKQRFEFFRQSDLSRLAGIVRFLNRLLSLTPISYRLVDIQSYDTEYIGLPEIRDFIFYFILHFEQDHILDYYLEVRNNELDFVVVKR